MIHMYYMLFLRYIVSMSKTNKFSSKMKICLFVTKRSFQNLQLRHFFFLCIYFPVSTRDFWNGNFVILCKVVSKEPKYANRQSLRRRQWHPTPVLLPRKSHGWRSPGRLKSMGLLESDTTEPLHFHFSLSCIGEGNGNPL